MLSLRAPQSQLVTCALLAFAFAFDAHTARASEPPYTAQLTSISAPRVDRPMIFLLQCWPEIKPCKSASDLELAVSDGTTTIPGSTTVRELVSGREVLVYFTPSTKLQKGVTYTASAPAETEAGATSTEVTVEPDSTDDPLAGVQIQEEWLPEQVGDEFMCTSGHELGNPNGEPGTFTLTFFAEERLSPGLTLSVPPVDGWLFKVDAFSSQWSTSLSERFPLTTGVERCLTVRALDAFSLEQQTREFCLTAGARDDVTTVPTTPSELQFCHDPPQRVEDEAAAVELVDAWCQQRGKFCEHMVDDLADCEALCDSCDPQRHGFAEWLCPTSPEVGFYCGVGAPSESEGQSASCQVHPGVNAGTWLPVWSVLGLALAWLCRRR